MKINTTNGMNIGEINEGNGGIVKEKDSFVQSINSQIASLEQQLQKLAKNEEMDPKEILQKKKEINQQITDLNEQLRQHQIEKQQEEEQKKRASNERMLGESSKTDRKQQEVQSVAISQEGMQALITAQNSIEKAQVQSKVATKMKGKAGVLEIEIKIDGERGGNTARKQEELAKIKSAMKKITKDQMNELTDANEKTKTALKDENQVKEDQQVSEKMALGLAGEEKKSLEKTDKKKENKEEKEQSTVGNKVDLYI